MQTENDN